MPAVHRSLRAAVHRRGRGARLAATADAHGPSGSGRSAAMRRHAPSGSTSSSSQQAPTASSRPSSSPQAWTRGRGGCRGSTDSVRLRDRPAEGAGVQGRNVARARRQARRALCRRADRSAAGLAESVARRGIRRRASRRRGRPRGCCPTCPPRPGPAVRAHPRCSARAAAASRSSRSAPASSIPSIWRAAPSSCAACAKRRVRPMTTDAPDVAGPVVHRRPHRRRRRG